MVNELYYIRYKTTSEVVVDDRRRMRTWGSKEEAEKARPDDNWIIKKCSLEMVDK